MSDSTEEKPKRRRNRIKTELKILYALEKILTEQGFDVLGVNAIAQEARVSKELIYRYFGGLEGLILAWMEERDYWSIRQIDAAEEILLARSASSSEILRDSLRTFLKDLKSKPQIQEIRRWEVASHSGIAERIARRREEAGVRLLSRLPKDNAEDVAAIYGILQAGLCYLVLRSTVLETYCGVNLRTEPGWKRIEIAVDRILDSVFTGEAKERIGTRLPANGQASAAEDSRTAKRGGASKKAARQKPSSLGAKGKAGARKT